MQEPSFDVCPWCDTELAWDPEIGPESVCPHCENELTGYRSIQVTLDEDDFENSDEVVQTSANIRSIKAAGNDTAKSSINYNEPHAIPVTDDSNMHTHRKEYMKKVEHLTDLQVEAPECHFCYLFMLFAGVEQLHSAQFQSASFPISKKPILPEKVELDIYVCPTCFKVEKRLSSSTRQSWMQNIGRS